MLLSVFFFLLVLPINHLAAKEGELVRMVPRIEKLYGMGQGWELIAFL